MASRLSKLVGCVGARGRAPLTSSRSFCCHSGCGGELADERGQRRGQRVVRRHHQETHVIDDILRRQQRAVLMGGLAELREQIVAAALGAADRNLLGEIGDDALAALDAARHLRAGQRLADHGDRGRHHVDEGARDLVDLGPDVGAEERGRGEVERELLHRGIEQHRSRLRLPLRHPRGDAGVELGEIGFHRPGLEGDRQRAAVQAMLLEIEQHQPARKQQAENPAPADASRRTAWPGRTARARWPRARAARGWSRRTDGCDRPGRIWRRCRSICPLGSASTSSVLPMIGQPSSPGICVSELRFGGVKL